MTDLAAQTPSGAAVPIVLLAGLFASNAVHDGPTQGWLITHLQEIGGVLYVLVQLCTLILLVRYLLRSSTPGHPSFMQRAHRFCIVLAKTWAETRHPWTEDDRP